MGCISSSASLLYRKRISYKVKKVEASLPQPYPLNAHELVHAVFLVELLDTSTCLVSLLLSGVEWMALRTNFNVDFRLGRSCNKCVTTVAGYGCLIVIWMDSFSHNFTSSMSYRLIYVTLLYTRIPDPYMALTASNDTIVRLHPDKQLTHCSIAHLRLQ